MPRAVIAALAVVTPIAWAVALPAARQTAIFPGTAWETATPESQGLTSAPFDALDEQIRKDVYGYVDHLLVVRGRPRGREPEVRARLPHDQPRPDERDRLRRRLHGPVEDARVQLLPPELASVLPGPRRAHAAIGDEVDRLDRDRHRARPRRHHGAGSRRSCRTSRTRTSRASTRACTAPRSPISSPCAPASNGTSRIVRSTRRTRPSSSSGARTGSSSR